MIHRLLNSSGFKLHLFKGYWSPLQAMYQFKTMEELHRGNPGKQFVVGSVGSNFDDFEGHGFGGSLEPRSFAFDLSTFQSFTGTGF